jgi:biopolymer transport protein ExbD
MRLRSFQHPSPAAKINVTPLIDVVMVLIIFYLIVGKLAAERQAAVRLPGSDVGVTPEGPAPVVLTIAPGDGAPRVLVDGTEAPIGGLVNVLRARLASEGEQPVVHVRADRSLPYSAVAPAVQACREAGLTSLRLVTERTGGRP